MIRLFLILGLLSACLPGLTQSTVLFEEPFDNNDRQWDTTVSDNYSFTISDGEYRMKNTGSTGYYATREVFCDPYADFEIELKIKGMGTSSNAGFGIFLIDRRRSKDVKRNHFLINAKGEFKVFTYNQSEEDHTVWKDWTASPVPINAAGEYNTLSIHRNRGRYSLKINGRPVHYHSDGDFWGKEIGIVLFEGEEVVVDHLKVMQDGRQIQAVDEEHQEVEKTNLGPDINTSESELLPIISHDGQRLYYVRDADDDQQVYYAESIGDDQWSAGKDIGFPINTDKANFVVSVTPDHNQLILGNHYKDDEPGISYSNRSSFGWAFPKSFEIDNYYNHNRHHEFTFSPNRKVLLMVCEREDSFGEKDIYISFLNEDEDQFSEPLNLGPSINTAGNEVSAFIAGDGSIYFSSDGHPGYGDNDIFLVRKLDDTWLNWSEPLNLGRGINTSGWDAYFTIPVTGIYAYVVSNADGYGKSDIFRVLVSEKARPEPVVLIKGKVLDAKSKTPIEARITYRDLINDQELGIAYSDKQTGEYQIILPHGRQYAFLAEEKGFFPVSANVDVRELDEYAEITQDLLLAPVEVGLVVRLNNIFFKYDDAALLDESHSELQRLSQLMRENPKLKIEIGGHTDDQGSDEYNSSLSQRRVESVVSYLVESGIEADRFTARGYGESSPVADNASEEGRAANRRVEFTILKN